MTQYLTTKPRLTENHRQFFERLDQIQVQRVLLRLEQDRVIDRRPVLLQPEEYTGAWLFEWCRRAGLDHATVVFPMCRENDTIGVDAVEKLIGRPNLVWKPPPPPTRPVLKDGTPVVRPPPGSFTPDQVLLKVAKNPKKPGSATWHRFNLYKAGMTVAALMSLGVTRADVVWDMDPSRKHIVLGSAAEWREQQEDIKDNG